MSNDKSNVAWILKWILEALLNGRKPRDAGGEDARLNKPLPQELYLPEFLRSVHMRAEAMCHAVVDWHHEQLANLVSGLRNSPFAIDTVSRKVEGAVQNVKTDIDRRIAHATADVATREKSAIEADKTYQRDLQAADASHPRGGWPDASVFLLIAAGVLLLDTAVSAWRLKHALGASTAFATGAVLSAVALGGGALAAFVLLHSTRHVERTRQGRALQWLGAMAITGVVLLLMYVGACYRAALIEGLNGGYADTLAKFNSPVEVLVNFDVLTLFLLGVAGFGIAAIEVWTYFHGHRPLLRQSGVAKAKADSLLLQLANELKSHAAKTGNTGDAVLNDIDRKSADWVRAAAGHYDEARALQTEARRRIDLVRRCARVIAAEYVDGYHEVRAADRFAPMPDPMIGDEIDVSADFTRIRDDAVAEARGAARAVQLGHLEIARIVQQAIIRIDEMSGFRAAHLPATPLLPAGQTP